jgi:uncharacterized protein (DUF1919 family)
MKLDIARKIASKIRKHHLQKYKRDNRFQSDVSIISNNCLAGILYSDFDLQFLSPTINLTFGQNSDFFHFVSYLKEYCQHGSLTYLKEEDEHPGFIGSPVATLSCKNLPDIEIHFLHYKSFDEAKESWERRCKRINYNKIFVAIEAQSEYEKSMIECYKDVKYPLVIFTDVDRPFLCCKQMTFYKKYGTGINCPITKFVSLFGRRGYDEYDFINNIFYLDYKKRSLNE